MSLDRFKASIFALVERMVGHRIDYLAAYRARVVTQAADGTLEVVPDSPRLPGMTGVPIRLGIPGTTVKVKAGAIVYIEFAGGDGEFPVATVWEATGLDEIIITSETLVSVNSPNVRLADGDIPIARQGDLVSVAMPLLIGTTKYSLPGVTDPTAVAFGVIVSGSAKAKAG